MGELGGEMVSRQQLEANRVNARRSTGPRTLEGKSRSKMNALTHGLSAKAIVVGDERSEDFEALRDAVIAHYQPSTELAMDAAERYAATLWRLHRIPAIEAALAEAAGQRAHDEECARLMQSIPRRSDSEARARFDEEYGMEDMILGDPRMAAIYDELRRRTRSKHRKRKRCPRLRRFSN